MTEEKKKPRRKNGEGGYHFNEARQLHTFTIERPRNFMTGERQPRMQVSSKDYNEALAKKRDAENKIEDGIDPRADKTTVSGWLQHWLATIVRPVKKPKTYVSYEGAVRKHIIPAFGETMKLKDLSPEHVRQMHEKIRAKSNGQSNQSARKAHEVLSTALKAAMVDDKVHRNVCSLVPKPKVSSKREGFSVPEVKQILKYCMETRPEEFARWASAFYLGSRQSECLGLQTTKIDLQTTVLNLDTQLQTLTKDHGCTRLDEVWEDTGKSKWSCGRKRGYACPDAKWILPAGHDIEHVHNSMFLTTPKSKAGSRAIPIVKPLAKAYEYHLANFYRPNKWNLLFTELGPNGEVRPVTTVHDQRAWKSLLEGAGVKHRPMHSARHTTATLLAKAKVPIEMIMSIIGHSQILATEGYIHIDIGVKAQAMNAAFDDMFGDDDDEMPAIAS